MANSPVSETIIDAVIAALDAVSIPNGDNTTLAYVARFSRFLRDDGKRPSVIVRWLGDDYSSYDSSSERTASTKVEVAVLLDYDPNSTVTTDVQTNLLGFDVVHALTHIDITGVDYDVGNISCVPLSEDHDEEPVDGLLIYVTFSYRVDYQDIHTSTGP